MSAQTTRAVLTTQIGAMAALAVAMGIGRFAYTPILPVMQQEYGFGADFGGLLASLNFVGYLIGALLTSTLPLAGRRTQALTAALLVSVLATLGMGFSDNIYSWGVLRLTAGIASAFVMVLAAALAIDALVGQSGSLLRAIPFSGVGTGIALTGLLTLWWDGWLTSQGMWRGLALTALPLTLISLIWLREVRRPAATTVTTAADEAMTPQARQLFGWLMVAYTLEGLGYIVTGTFLVAIVRDLLDWRGAGNLTWVVVGLSSASMTPLWSEAARRWGTAKLIAVAHILQAIGIVLPVLGGNLAAALVSAILFGSTLQAIGLLTLNLGRALAPRRSTAVIGALTVVFSVGQIIGPLAGGYVATAAGSFEPALWAAAAAVALGGVLLWAAERRIGWRG